jgi:hypothetical protein
LVYHQANGAMMTYATTQSNRRARLLSRLRELLQRTEKERLHLDAYLELFGGVRSSPDWQKTTESYREYLTGYAHATLESWRSKQAFVYVTGRGPVRMSYDAKRVPMLPAMTDKECHDVDAKNYPRGTVWIPEAAGDRLQWWHGPNDDSGKAVR